MKEETLREFNNQCARFLGWQLIKEDNYFKWLKPNNEKIATFKPLGFDTYLNRLIEVKNAICNLNTKLVYEFDVTFNDGLYSAHIMPLLKDTFHRFCSFNKIDEITCLIDVIQQFLKWYYKK